MTESTSENSTAAKRIALATADTLEGSDVLGSCYVTGKVVEVQAAGAVVEFRNPHGGPYRSAIDGRTWTLEEQLEAGDKVEIQFALLSHPETLEDDTVVVGIPGGDKFFVAGDTVET